MSLSLRRHEIWSKQRVTQPAYTRLGTRLFGRNIMAEVLLLPPPPELFFLPQGTYGISFDLSTRSILDPLPNGWGFRNTSPVYRRIRDALENADFDHPQRSVYQQDHTFAMNAWGDMLHLRAIRL
ncbi:hypothetical protein F5887DRAFT_577351 [Amanita rubescens]|nr:hypothetical protein F5887DRAFT_577351 [Amanita rubescens]